MATKIQILKKDKTLNQQVFFGLLDDMIKESIKGIRTKKNGKKLALTSVKMYYHLRTKLLQFTEVTKFEIKIYIDQNLTINEKIAAKKYYSKFYNRFTEYLYKGGCYDNYVGSIIKLLRAFFNYLLEERHISVGSYHKSFYAPKDEIPIIALSVSQLNYIIYDKEFNKQLKQLKLVQIRDVFVFGCTVALRISDLFSLSHKNLTIIGTDYYLKVRSQKTATSTSVKLPDYAAKIVKRYKRRNGLLLPEMTPQWFNRKLKCLAKLLPDDFELVKVREKRGKQMVVYLDSKKRTHYKLSDHITSHTMRKTAITTMLTLGMPEHVVRKISGHAANSREFYRYVMLAQDVIDNESDKVFDQIKNYHLTKSDS